MFSCTKVVYVFDHGPVDISDELTLVCRFIIETE